MIKLGDHRRRWILGFAAAALIVAVEWGFKLRADELARFEPTKWATARAEKDYGALKAMARDAAFQRMLLGITEPELLHLLGTPKDRWPRVGVDHIDRGEIASCGYSLGQGSVFEEHLIVEIVNGRVAEVWITH